jgi:hypothetical protein
VELLFDPARVTYDRLLDIFWENHDPTQVNGQGPDTGSSYRSVIFYHTEEQRKKAEASKARLQASGKYSRPVVTEIVPAGTFWRAEEYHQQFYEKSGRGYCAAPNTGSCPHAGIPPPARFTMFCRVLSGFPSGYRMRCRKLSSFARFHVDGDTCPGELQLQIASR